MKSYSEIKSLPFKELRDISPRTIEIHYSQLYQGYVRKWQELQERLKSGSSRDLKVEESFLADAIILHEAYFDILGGDGKPKGEVAEKMDLQEFKALGLVSRGWVILAYDFNDGKLKNYIADAHNLHGIWGAAPIIVMDMYEHAYFIDFGSDKKAYIEAFFQNLNWEAIDKKFKHVR